MLPRLPTLVNSWIECRPESPRFPVTRQEPPEGLELRSPCTRNLPIKAEGLPRSIGVPEAVDRHRIAPAAMRSPSLRNSQRSPGGRHDLVTSRPGRRNIGQPFPGVKPRSQFRRKKISAAGERGRQRRPQRSNSSRRPRTLQGSLRRRRSASG